MDQYMALSKKDLMIHITLNELYNTHSLLLQHIDTLVSGNIHVQTTIYLIALGFFRRLTTSSICVSLRMNLEQHLLKFLARRIGRSSCTSTVAGRPPSRTSRARYWTVYHQVICCTWRRNQSLCSSFVPCLKSQRNVLIIYQASRNVPLQPKMRHLLGVASRLRRCFVSLRN